MKKLQILFGILVILILIVIAYCCFCRNDEPVVIKEVEKPHISRDQVVVEFIDSLINKDSVREKYGVETFETCDCGNDNLELWTLDVTKMSVEGAVSSLGKDDSAEGELDGNHQMFFQIPTPTVPVDSLLKVNFKPDVDVDITEGEHSANSINIAIVDTGILPDYFLTSGNILYDTQIHPSCKDNRRYRQGSSGWNFINNSSDVTDRHGHGTYIAKIITTELDSKEINYRILPLKVFDDSGAGSYWDVVCAMSYLKELPDIHLVNTSFGFYGALKYGSILKDLIKDIQARTLVVSSSGNVDNYDTDSPGKEHSPSGFPLDNILSVGGFVLDSTNTTLVPFINGNNGVEGITIKGSFGATSIDLAARFDEYNLKMIAAYPTQLGPFSYEANLQGTSYGTAFVTARAAIAMDGINTMNLKNKLFQTTLQSDALINNINGGRVLLRNTK